MVERNDHREKAERLEKRLEKERQTYEKNTASVRPTEKRNRARETKKKKTLIIVTPGS
jgi:hypothetical protein